ncbi:MAG: glycosyltransferase [Acidobacteriota bacterium]
MTASLMARRAPLPAKGAVPRLRPPVAVLVSRFPLITETFILREVMELERQGQPVRLVPLLRETPDVVHEESIPWVSRALYTPFVSPEILAANLRTLARQPCRYLSLLTRVLVGSASSFNLFIGTLGIFPKSVYLAEQLSHEGVGHLHAHFATHPAMAAFIISRLTGISFSFTAHAHDIFLHRAMLGEKLRKASFVRVISRFNKEFLTTLYPAVGADKFHIIHMGLDEGRFRLPMQSPSPRQADDGIKVLTVAAFKPYKGLPVLVEACRRLKERGLAFQCELVGDGPDREAIEALISEKGLSGEVHVLGPRTQREVAGLMARASVFVLPSVIHSTGQMEGIPVVLMEAMAAAKPVVASSLSGVGELVEDQVTGILAEPGDAEALAAAILRIESQPLRARFMGERGRRKVLNGFRVEDTVSRLVSLIDRFGASVPKDDAELIGRSAFKGFRDRTVGIRRIRDGSDSRVLELAVAGGAQIQELVYKVHKSRPGESRPATERARREFELLGHLARGFASRPRADNYRFGVPRPLHLDEDAAAVVLEACPGVRFDSLLKKDRLSLDPHRLAALESFAEGCGQWLRVFQAQTLCRGDGTAALDALLERAGNDLDRCESRILGPGHARHIRERLTALREQIHPSSLALCGHHGDFWPGNIYVHEEAVRVMDFEGFREGLDLEDVAYYLVHLELVFSHPLARRLLRPRLRRLCRAFLKGYLAGRSLDGSLYALTRVAAALQTLARPPRGRWSARWGRRALPSFRLQCRES